MQSKKAKEVAYREREKGRDVAVVAQAQGNVFEIDVFPLPFDHQAFCRLFYSHTDAALLELPFKFDEGTEIVVDSHCASCETLVPPECCPDNRRACVGTCFGERHFACYVPNEVETNTFAPKRLALVWDVSGSQDMDHSMRFRRIRELATHCPFATFDVWTFGVSFKLERAGVSVDDAIDVLERCPYDGGTDLGMVSRLLAESGPIDAALLFSDGMDNLNRRPTFAIDCPPIHCVSDQAEVNWSTLRHICASTGGQLLTSDYLSVLRFQTWLMRIETDQDDASFCDQSDGFKCCPDHRLQVRHVVPREGLWLCGVVGSVKKISVELQIADKTRMIAFDLSAAHQLGSDAAPLLGYLFAQEQYSFVEKDAARMGVDLHRIKESLALQYSFCSPESSLVMLYEPSQFVENGVLCPAHHPAYAFVTMSHEESVKSMRAASEEGLGQPKTDNQFNLVERLATELNSYIKNPSVCADKGRRNSRDRDGSSCCYRSGFGLSFRASRYAYSARDCDRDADFDLGGCDLLDVDCGDFLDAAPQASSFLGGPSRQLDCVAYVQGAEDSYLEALKQAVETDKWEEVYQTLRRKHATSPSFFLYAARLLAVRSPHLWEEAARICTNCFEFNVQDCQMMRSVGYLLIKVGKMDLAMEVLDHVRFLASMEPQSFLDGALVRTLYLQHQGRSNFDENMLREALQLASVVITHQWAERFREVEWPALVLIHVLCEAGERKYGLTGLWPLRDVYRVQNFSIGLMVWLGWDTDKTDIDLHVVEPSGNVVNYSNNRSAIGGHLSRDFTQGYGPEVYLLKSPPKGTYQIRAKYYASHQQSALTGATSAVLWALVQTDGPKSEPKLVFDTVRLDRNKESMDVLTVHVAGEFRATSFLSRCETDRSCALYRCEDGDPSQLMCDILEREASPAETDSLLGARDFASEPARRCTSSCALM
eukprot:TRINITY_DN16836_c0_g1_i1.p1 TRINITY_DN16836_c0_g1~~TRINITY_DN16836_c0_g1_i1.p1  ORF type:complete len:1033 (+),score=89.01 TRINITY_DN16836_c0_g1_i1:289-3099(+)